MERQGSHWQAVRGGLTLASSWAPTQLLSQSLHPQQDGAENRKNRSKICELRHRQFNRWRKEKKANNKQEIINLPQGHSMSNRHQRSQSPPFFFFYLSLRCWAQCHTVQNIPWAQMSCPSCVPSKCLAHPQPTHCRAEWEWEKALMLCKHKAVVKTLCFISTVLATDPEHSTVQAALKKVDSVPAGPSAASMQSRGTQARQVSSDSQQSAVTRQLWRATQLQHRAGNSSQWARVISARYTARHR